MLNSLASSGGIVAALRGIAVLMILGAAMRLLSNSPTSY